MLVDGGRLLLSPSDLLGFLACEHLTRLELAAARGEHPRPERDDPELDVVAHRGIEHEQRYLADLHAAGIDVTEVAVGDGEWTIERLAAAAQRTADAMREGVPAIYQGVLFDGRWMGFADFLVRVETPSQLGSWSYEVEDTKLARQVKPAALLQMCAYSEQVAAIQGVEPAEVHVVLGNGQRHSFPTHELSAYYRTVKRQFEQALELSDPTYPDPVSHCALCRWLDRCDGQRRADDHLSLVAGMRRDQTLKLSKNGIRTAQDLAAAPSDLRVERIGGPTLDRLKQQARLQIAERNDGQRHYELLEPHIGEGLCRLPEPTPGDLFLDLEGDPFIGDEGLEYLFGVVEIDPEGQPVFHPFWAHDETQERRAFEHVVDLIMDRLDRHPDMHVYHYATYEETALKRLMGRYGTREDEVDRLLRGRVLVDLYRVVRQGVRVSAESYSIKKLEPLYMASRVGQVNDAASSIVAYEQWLETADPAILDDIAAYNRDDCISTWKLRDWLEERRFEAASQYGNTAVPRPDLADQEPPPTVGAAQDQVEALSRELLDGVPDDPSGRSQVHQARWLLAQLLSWHRREAKSEWWMYFTRMEMADEELVEDPECIGGLEFIGDLGPEKRSRIHRYRFDPAQEHTLKIDQEVHAPEAEGRIGTIFHLDDVRGIVDVKTTRPATEPPATALIPQDIIRDTVQREAIQRVARWVIDNNIDPPGAYRAARDLLLAHSPRIRGGVDGEPLSTGDELVLDAATRLVSELDGSTLPVQGPPGAGKTYTAARVILDLVRQGKRVGITALSHKAIGNLLDEFCRAAASAGLPVRALQKASDDQRCASQVVECTNKNAEVERRLRAGDVDIIAGTSWLLSREALEGTLDVLFVDEASQLPLANAVAVAGAARNLVLVGDPQQLAQPSKGSHPPGSGVSALDHMLAGHATVPSHRGLFLDTTYRLHPDICAFTSEIAYDSRLEPHTSCHVQSLEEGELAGGTGLRYIPVDHVGDRTSSSEEAAVVARLIDDLLGLDWTGEDGETRPLTLDDIVVVAPYNDQVAQLRDLAPENARVGTVDKFQGQEAPVAIYSMATATPEDMPRVMEFLYSLNRLNVAVSRARGLAVLVASPRLLTVRCRRPEQIRLANALCRFVEMAKVLDARDLNAAPK